MSMVGFYVERGESRCPIHLVVLCIHSSYFRVSSFYGLSTNEANNCHDIISNTNRRVQTFVTPLRAQLMLFLPVEHFIIARNTLP